MKLLAFLKFGLGFINPQPFTFVEELKFYKIFQ